MMFHAIIWIVQQCMHRIKFVKLRNSTIISMLLVIYCVCLWVCMCACILNIIYYTIYTQYTYTICIQIIAIYYYIYYIS